MVWNPSNGGGLRNSCFRSPQSTMPKENLNSRLSKLVKSAIVQAHGNADLEQGFSSDIVTKERNTLTEETVVALPTLQTPC